MMADGGEQDFRAVLGEHAPQPAGVIVHPDGSDAGQCDRPGPVVIPYPDRGWFALEMLVAQPKRRDVAGLLLEPREADPFPFALARA
ncbi:hypothetical protein [Mycobacterium sp.]|uniref:hypothetical protein n=1 Tax=Mycobacterium sp. TaxID=1785 RepID=UPI003D6BC95A